MSIQIDDEVLMAYADGELDAVQAAEVEQAMQADAGIAARVAQHRALRAKLESGLRGVLSEPVPQRLLDTLRMPAAPTGKVIELAQAKHARVTQARNWGNREWGALAASLIAGIVIGMYAMNFTSRQLVGEQGGALVAQGELDEALTTQLTSTAHAAPVQIGISFRNRDGAYCRSFVLDEQRPLAGLACREREIWRVQMLSETRSEPGEFRQAASAIPASVLALVEQQIDGEPLDAEAETAARNGGWK